MKYIKKFENNTIIADELNNAINNRDLITVKYILNSNKDFDINTPNRYGNTPLIYASTSNNILLFREIFNNGANINVQNNAGMTPLMCVIYNDKDDGYSADQHNIVKILIDAGADWNIKNNKGLDFIYYLSDDLKKELVSLYPDKYQDYLMKKDADYYNL